MATVEPLTKRISKTEVAVLSLIVVGGFSLLLPALPASRESARMNLCQRNLRWLDLVTQDYLQTKRRLPDAATWPVELLPLLQHHVGREKPRPTNNVFSMNRPMFLTCPSQADPNLSPNQAEPSHYVFLVDRQQRGRWDLADWKFRDQPIADPQQPRRAWYIGSELSFADGEDQLRQTRGPHADGVFLESDSLGESVIRTPIE